MDKTLKLTDPLDFWIGICLNGDLFLKAIDVVFQNGCLHLYTCKIFT